MIETSAGLVEWVRADAMKVRFSHRGALLYLQGEKLNRFFPAWLLLRGEVSPPFGPLLEIKDVVLAFVQEVPDSFKREELLSLLLAQVLT